MKTLSFVLLLSLAGCAELSAKGMQDTLPRVESGLVALEAAYQAGCEPTPKGAEKFCADVKAVLDEAKLVVSAHKSE